MAIPSYDSVAIPSYDIMAAVLTVEQRLTAIEADLATRTAEVRAPVPACPRARVPACAHVYDACTCMQQPKP